MVAKSDVPSVVTEDISPVAAVGMSSVATRDINSAATESLCYCCNRRHVLLGTQDMAATIATSPVVREGASPALGHEIVYGIRSPTVSDCESWMLKE